MKYTPEEVIQFVQEENVRFIRLAFCNVYGKQHNVSIMPSELKRAFAYGIAFDASAVDGFGGEIRSDLLLHPDPSTLIQLPWRPEQGKVMQMFCDISYPDGRAFERDTRSLCITLCGNKSRIGNTAHHICINRELVIKKFTGSESCIMYADTVDYAVRSCNINIFKKAERCFIGQKL